MGTIRIRTGFFPLAFLLFFFPPRVRIDGGEPQKLGWFKTTDLSVAPGPHRLLVNHPYIVPSWDHKAEVDVTVGEGQVVLISYRAPVLAFLPGKLRVQPT
jgi:hypothetical protein